MFGQDIVFILAIPIEEKQIMLTDMKDGYYTYEQQHKLFHARTRKFYALQMFWLLYCILEVKCLEGFGKTEFLL